jgi:Fe-S cluster assembly protein SufD
VELEPDASLTLAQTHAGAGGASLTNVFTDLRVGERAALRFVKTQAEGAEAFHFGGLLSRQAAGSRVSLVDATFGARLSRSDLCARIEGEGAAAELHGLYALQARQTADFHTALDHRVPGGVSRQVYKGILDEKSRAVFNGRIFVRPGARGTDAYQINRNLLLSRQAVVDTKPQLEIDNDDVKCTHGATIGQMDRGQLFYLQSRGIGRAEAEALLARGFAAEVLSRVEHAGLRARLHGLLDRYFAAAGERRDG